ncbi:MAG: 50S ribosomal protein L21e [Candidatus Aenigmatarchaeota archaeon]
MVVKSHGARRRTREKFRKTKRMTVNQFMKKFSKGDKVAIKIESGVQKMPFRRFYGLTGEVIGKRGRAYIVQIKDGNKLKKIIAKPEHLKKL